MKGLIVASFLVLTLSVPAPGPAVGARRAPRAARSRRWAQDLLRREADYIVNCSFTEDTRNNGSVRPSADAYGAINVDRISERGPDWVRPGEAAMGVIGLMAAAIRLKADGINIARYDRVLDRFFRTWVLARQQPINPDAASADYGGFFERVYYDAGGRWKGHDDANAGVTGQMLAAMWKYYEYKAAIRQTGVARKWLRQSWPIARRAGDFLKRNYNARYHLVRSNAARSDLWISDSTYAAMALRCLARWAYRLRGSRRQAPSSRRLGALEPGAGSREVETFHYAALARFIVFGLQRLKDTRTRRAFFRYRDSSHRYQPTYGDQIDQLCFLPYEADVIDPGESFARSISDWWTHGSHGFSLTFQSSDRSDWRTFGSHYSYPLRREPVNHNLYPGPGLQLAKVEWKHAWHVGDKVALQRARKRFEWARSVAYSNLWLGGSGVVEANVPNGLVDWRDATNYAHTAGDWARFVDTSAYFIEVTLMLEYGVDTKYVPN